MNTVKATKLPDNLVLNAFRDSRVAGIRWDLITWSLVLDLDAPEGEMRSPNFRRGWIVFSGVTDFTIPFNNVRLPLGFWITSNIQTDAGKNSKFSLFSFQAQLPVFKDQTQTRINNRTIKIQAQEIFGVASTASMKANEYGILEPLQRSIIASDEEMLMAC